MEIWSRHFLNLIQKKLKKISNHEYKPRFSYEIFNEAFNGIVKIKEWEIWIRSNRRELVEY